MKTSLDPKSIALGLAILTTLGLGAFGQDPAKSESPLVRLLKSGRAPEERQRTIIDMIGKRGGAVDLTYLFDRAAGHDGFSPAMRRKALDALAQAAMARQVKPEGPLDRLGPLITAQGTPAETRLAAIRLAGLWKVEALRDALRAIAEAPDAGTAQRAAALEALVAIGGTESRSSIAALLGADRPFPIRVLAAAALAKLEPGASAERAVAVLRDARPGEDLAPLLSAFLHHQGGAEKLAAAITPQTLPADPAKLALRALYALGRTDASLVAALSNAAGLDTEVKPLDKTQLDQLMADVAARGNPERGERVFRRADLNCTKCHAVSGAGGGVGPDLSGLGSSSPADYIIHSVMTPDQAIKEEFQTRLVLTNDGQVYHGIVVDKDDQRIILKEATGEQRLIPAADIEDSKEGGSLMPKGLVAFMTRDEFVDLVRFLSELGKPGPYAIRSTPSIQRWRVLKPVPEAVRNSVPDPETFRKEVLGAESDHWLPAYGKVAGGLPLDEMTALVGSPVVYVQGELEVTAPGLVAFRLDSAEGLHGWLDDQPVSTGKSFTSELTKGRHTITLRLDASRRRSKEVKVELSRPEGSAAEFTVIGGR